MKCPGRGHVKDNTALQCESNSHNIRYHDHTTKTTGSLLSVKQTTSVRASVTTGETEGLPRPLFQSSFHYFFSTPFPPSYSLPSDPSLTKYIIHAVSQFRSLLSSASIYMSMSTDVSTSIAGSTLMVTSMSTTTSTSMSPFDLCFLFCDVSDLSVHLPELIPLRLPFTLGRQLGLLRYCEHDRRVPSLEHDAERRQAGETGFGDTRRLDW